MGRLFSENDTNIEKNNGLFLTKKAPATQQTPPTHPLPLQIIGVNATGSSGDVVAGREMEPFPMKEKRGDMHRNVDMP